jgi:asparagine synthase (glutamine-hydrolysing)
MCGIAGVINRSNKINQDLFDKMLDELKERGPDDRGTYFEERLALGNRRLAIIDLSQTGHQPVFNENKNVVVVFNGEIYNYQALRNRINRRHKFRGVSDTEILVHLYEEKGEKLVYDIEGMFAFAIYNKEEDKLTLVRDHFGKKPLYYYFDGETFSFASEMKSFLVNPIIKNKLTINRNSLTKLLFYGYIPSSHSIFNEIKKLEPATLIQFDIRKWRISKRINYWDLPHAINNNYTEDEILIKTKNLLTQSLKKRLIADVPIGILLSGGVDSSLLTCLLAEMGSNCEAYVVRSEKDDKDSESSYAKQVANRCGIKLNVVHIKSSEILDSFIQMHKYISEPIVDPALYPLFFISKYLSKNIKVVLSGDGGDEIFGGYEKYRAQFILEKLREFPFLGMIGNMLNRSLSVIPFGSNQKIEVYKKFFNNFKTPSYARQFIFGSGSFEVEEVMKLLNIDKIDLHKIFEDSVYYNNRYKGSDIINKILYLDCKIQLPDWYLSVRDRATMAASIEMRNPYLDKSLTEYLFQLPGHFKIRNGITKYLSKKLLSKYLPDAIVYRNKRGFEIPFNQWICKPLKNLYTEYLNDKRLKDYFNTQYINNLFKDHLSGRQNNQFKLARIFTFSYWLKTYKIN